MARAIKYMQGQLGSPNTSGLLELLGTSMWLDTLTLLDNQSHQIRCLELNPTVPVPVSHRNPENQLAKPIVSPVAQVHDHTP